MGLARVSDLADISSLFPRAPQLTEHRLFDTWSTPESELPWRTHIRTLWLQWTMARATPLEESSLSMIVFLEVTGGIIPSPIQVIDVMLPFPASSSALTELRFENVVSHRRLRKNLVKHTRVDDTRRPVVEYNKDPEISCHYRRSPCASDGLAQVPDKTGSTPSWSPGGYN
ncbi:uncharacterized protein BT62DRAFT_1080717 [Guyanagaster necrorhizus]|uniref:Uncharacterized protein n=1 Tax=Guyanagaster necrorhizus TaxID=856835 RepID=A0A9P8AMC2_9AGAR|nr:uncharacterized protein BT62DRAFT_1080717 [Guyanagaster necrorhizus MCA 3950]KAG7440584.1 hypothetical protein BT62DRAFT_1080717 [Guyanagaster necrorhizus MCA 3950]